MELNLNLVNIDGKDVYVLENVEVEFPYTKSGKKKLIKFLLNLGYNQETIQQMLDTIA